MSSLLFLMDVAAFVAVAWWILPRAGLNGDAGSGWFGMDSGETRKARRARWSGEAASSSEPRGEQAPAPRWRAR